MAKARPFVAVVGSGFSSLCAARAIAYSRFADARLFIPHASNLLEAETPFFHLSEEAHTVVDSWKKQHSVCPQDADIIEGVLTKDREWKEITDGPQNYYLFFEGFLWGSGVYQWGKIYENSVVKRIDQSGGKHRIYTDERWLFREMDALVVGTSSPLAKIAFPNYEPVVRYPDHFVIRLDYAQSQRIPLESFKVEGNKFIEKVQITDNKYVFLESGEYAWIFSTPAFARRARSSRNAVQELVSEFEKLMEGALGHKLSQPVGVQVSGLCSRKSPEESILQVDEEKHAVLWDDNYGFGFEFSDMVSRATTAAHTALATLDLEGVEGLKDPQKMFEWVHGRVQGDIIESHMRDGPMPGVGH